MVSLGTHVVKVGQPVQANRFELFQRYALIPILVHDAEYCLDNVIRLLLVLNLILSDRLNNVHIAMRYRAAYLRLLL